MSKHIEGDRPQAPFVAQGELPAADRRRSEIASIAADLFAENGYHKTSMNSVARRAGISKPTLYHYFDGKAAILYRIHYEYLTPLLARHRSLLDAGVDPTQLLRTVIRDVLEIVDSRRGEVRVFNENFKELPPDQKSEVRAQRDAYQGVVEEALRRGIATGDYRPQRDIHVTALAFFGLVNGAYQWYHKDGALTHAEIADVFADIVLCGLKSR